jgi:hypothetical protein
MTPPSRITTYWIPRGIVDRSWALLRQDGLKGVESTLLWGGRRFGTEAVVLAVLYPCGFDVALDRRFVRVGPDTTAEMGRWLRSQGLAGLIQVHTHPSAWTGHSKTDNDFPIAASDGFVSVVWPNFARQPVEDPSDLGVHQLEAGRWRVLDRHEAHDLLRFVETEAMVWAPHPATATFHGPAEGSPLPRRGIHGESHGTG